MSFKQIYTCLAFVLFASISYGQIYDVSATALPGNEVVTGSNPDPDGVSNGSADVTGTYDAATNMLTVSVTYTNLTSDLTMAHLHLNAAGSNGGVIHNFFPMGGPTPPTGLSGTFSGTFTVLPGNETALLNSGVYINLHTVDFGAGELRDQLGLTFVSVVPTMGQWGMIALGLLLLIIGIVSIRQRQGVLLARA